MDIRQGDIVRVERVPPGIEGMPDETLSIFRRCVGKQFPVSQVDDQQGYVLLEIEVKTELSGSMKELSDSIWIEPEHVSKINRKQADASGNDAAAEQDI